MHGMPLLELTNMWNLTPPNRNKIQLKNGLQQRRLIQSPTLITSKRAASKQKPASRNHSVQFMQTTWLWLMVRRQLMLWLRDSLLSWTYAKIWRVNSQAQKDIYAEMKLNTYETLRKYTTQLSWIVSLPSMICQGSTKRLCVSIIKNLRVVMYQVTSLSWVLDWATSQSKRVKEQLMDKWESPKWCALNQTKKTGKSQPKS